MVLVGLLSGLGGLLQVRGKTDIDGPISKLHHNFTTSILLCFCLLVTANNLVGDPIKCTFNDHPLMKEDVVNTYCWIHSTFTFPRHFRNAPAAAHPGVGPKPFGSNEKVYYAYYQWVPFVLCLQALLFYIPHWLWKTWEGGMMKAASMGFSTPFTSRAEHKEKVQMLAEYLHNSLKKHNTYAFKYLFSELLNFAVTITNICLLNKFLDGGFISYGPDVFSFLQTEAEDRTDPMIYLFPRMTKCTFKTIGPSGTVQLFDSLCVLPQNIINEKLYVFLWLWFWFLLVADAVGVLYRCVVFFNPWVRFHLLKSYTMGLNNEEMKPLKNLQVGDYFVFYLLYKNVSRLFFSALVREMCERIGVAATNNFEMKKVLPGAYHLMNEAGHFVRH